MIADTHLIRPYEPSHVAYMCYAHVKASDTSHEALYTPEYAL